jgi:hypothetical protein
VAAPSRRDHRDRDDCRAKSATPKVFPDVAKLKNRYKIGESLERFLDKKKINAQASAAAIARQAVDSFSDGDEGFCCSYRTLQFCHQSFLQTVTNSRHHPPPKYAG